MSIHLSPEAFRALGHQAIELLLAHWATFDDPAHTPVRHPVPPEARAALLGQPAPTAPTDPATLLDAFAAQVLPYPMGNNHPRFFAWINSPAAPLGVLAALLAAGMNASVAGGDHAATYVEHAVLGWLRAWLGLPEHAGGLLVGGGSEANLVGLAAMRHHATHGAVRAHGLASVGAGLTIYTSTQGHSAIQKAAELLGFGAEALRRVPTDTDFRLDVAALRAMIHADRAAGLRPVCVAASAGTVNTGAVDPLDALADLCAAEGLWLHVDGAYGAVGVLAVQTAGLGGLFDGLARADSWALDPHKWLSIPVDCGCAFVRDAKTLRAAFSLVPPYLRDDAELPWFSEYGVQQTRAFRALKLWFVMQQVGRDGYRDLITRDIMLARALQDRIRAHPRLTLAAAGPLSITCFRATPPGTPAERLDALQVAVVAAVQRGGQAFLTRTDLNNQTVLRACIVNFRTTEDDLDALLAAVDAAATAHVGL